MSETDEQIDVRGDGRIILYKRPGLKNPKWQARIRVPNAKEYKIVSTKTANLKEAERFALDLYEDLYLHVKSGGSIKAKTFRQVFEEWEANVETMGPNRQGGSWKPTVDRVRTYALRFFGPMKITEIGQAEFTDFWAWRKSNFNRTAPSNGTLKRERTSLLPVFRFALSKGYVSKIPETNPPKTISERRPTFTPAEWKVIRTGIFDWVEDGKTKGAYRHRYTAQQCFTILASTGMRIGELREIRWNDLWTVKKKQGSYLASNVAGKTGKREIVFNPGAEVSIKLLYNLQCKELEKRRPDLENPTPNANDLVVGHRDGTSIKSMRRSFRSLLAYCNIPLNRDGKPRTIYSLRHLYATRQLSKEASPFLIAKQMGTSIEMLEKHYGQTITSSLASEITKGEPANITMRNDRAYPFE